MSDYFFQCAESNLTAAKEELSTVSALEMQVAKLSRIVEDSYVFPLYHSEKITGNLTCGAQDVPQEVSGTQSNGPPTPKAANVSVPPVPIEIDYQSPPNLAGSAGIVVSLLGRPRSVLRRTACLMERAPLPLILQSRISHPLSTFHSHCYTCFFTARLQTTLACRVASG